MTVVCTLVSSLRVSLLGNITERQAGTDEPAVDCILRGKDAAEYRGGLTFRHDISEMESKQQKPTELIR